MIIKSLLQFRGNKREEESSIGKTIPKEALNVFLCLRSFHISAILSQMARVPGSISDLYHEARVKMSPVLA